MMASYKFYSLKLSILGAFVDLNQKHTSSVLFIQWYFLVSTYDIKDVNLCVDENNLAYILLAIMIKLYCLSSFW